MRGSIFITERKRGLLRKKNTTITHSAPREKKRKGEHRGLKTKAPHTRSAVDRQRGKNFTGRASDNDAARRKKTRG